MSPRAPVLVLVVLVVATAGWLFLRDASPEAPQAAASPLHAPAAPAADVEEAELVAPDAREAVETPAPEQEPEAALTDGIVAPPTPPLPDFEARYADVPPDELEVRRDLLQKQLHELAMKIHEERFERGEFKTLVFPPGEDATYGGPDKPDSMMTRAKSRPDGSQIMEISEFDSATHPQTQALRAEITWLSRKVSENNTVKK